MQTIWITYLLAAIAASVLFVAAGWRGRQPIGASLPYARPDLRMLVVPPDAGPDQTAPGANPRDDVSAAIYLALARLALVIASQFVKVDVAVRPGLKVRMRGPVLANMLEELVAVAIRAAPASRLLLTAAEHGDRIHISVTDDMPGGDSDARRVRIRTLTERVALHGDALVVDVRPQEGTSMTLQLAGDLDAAAAQ